MTEDDMERMRLEVRAGCGILAGTMGRIRVCGEDYCFIHDDTRQCPVLKLLAEQSVISHIKKGETSNG